MTPVADPCVCVKKRFWVGKHTRSRCAAFSYFMHPAGTLRRLPQKWFQMLRESLCQFRQGDFDDEEKGKAAHAGANS